jgi:hypothetical protein
MSKFKDIELFDNTSLSDVFKQIYKNNKAVDKQINDLINVIKPIASNSPGQAINLMPIIKDLFDVSVKNNEHLIKMAAVAQRANNSSSEDEASYLPSQEEISKIIEDQKVIIIEGNNLIDKTKEAIQISEKIV